MSKHLSAKYYKKIYQENKERLQKKRSRKISNSF